MTPLGMEYPHRIELPSRVPAAVARRLLRTRRRLQRRFARPIVRPGPRPQTTPASPRVEVFIASLDTCAATELTIRSLRAHDHSEYDIVVGDGGSTDGSIEMLEQLHRQGWLRLERRSDRWGHHEWIEHRIATSAADYVVFCDSDMEFRRPHVVRDLVGTARRTGSALVAAEFCLAGPGVEPVSGSQVVMAARPSAWLFLVEPVQVRQIDASFAFTFTPKGTAVEGGHAYDTGAAWFAELSQRGLPWAAMPGAFTRRYRHHGGLTWRPLLGLVEDRRTQRLRDDIDRKLIALRECQRAP